MIVGTPFSKLGHVIGSDAFWVLGRFVDITIETLKKKSLINPIFLTIKDHIFMHLFSKGLVKIHLTYQEYASLSVQFC